MAGRWQISVTSRWSSAPPRCASRSDAESEKGVRGRVFPLRVARWEVRADIAVAQRSKDGVGRRVQADIGVRVPDQSVVVGDGAATQHHVIARPEPMHVEAGSDADVAGVAQQAFRPRQVIGRRNFQIVGFARHQRDVDPSRLRDSCVVGKVITCRGAVRVQQLRKMKTLWRCARHSPERGTVAAMRPSASRFNVSVTGSAAMAPDASSSAASTRPISVADAIGRTASWINTRSGPRPSQASRPARTEAWRLAPPMTGLGNANADVARTYISASSRWITTCTWSTAA